MDRQQFREQLDALGLDCQKFAEISGYNPKTVYDFGGRTSVPRLVRTYLMTLKVLKVHQIPIPTELGQRSHRLR